MNEVIENVLNDENLTTTEERAEALRKGLATLVIPKDKYNDISNRLKATETSLTSLQTEYDEFKQSKMTADEKAENEKKELEKAKKQNAVTRSELAVEKLLLKNGIEIKEDDVELKETLQNIVSEDYEKSIKLANNFITLLNKTKETTEKQTVTDLLNNTPKPVVGSTTNNVSNFDTYKAKFDEAVKQNDVLAQAQYLRLMQEEQTKNKSLKI